MTATAVQEAVVVGRKALPPIEGVTYYAAMDPAFAQGGDAFTFAIAHAEQSCYILDRLDTWRGRNSPLSSDAVLDEIAQLATEYHVSQIVSDQYAVVPLADGLRRRNIVVKAQPLSNELKADIYTSLKRAVNTGQVELLDDPQLVAELIALEVRPTPSGKPKIGAMAGHHDDRAIRKGTTAGAESDARVVFVRWPWTEGARAVRRLYRPARGSARLAAAPSATWSRNGSS